MSLTRLNPMRAWAVSIVFSAIEQTPLVPREQNAELNTTGKALTLETLRPFLLW